MASDYLRLPSWMSSRKRRVRYALQDLSRQEEELTDDTLEESLGLIISDDAFKIRVKLEILFFNEIIHIIPETLHDDVIDLDGKIELIEQLLGEITVLGRNPIDEALVECRCHGGEVGVLFE